MICPSCGERINAGTANRHKPNGVYMHKTCPTAKPIRVVRKAKRDKRKAV